MRFFNTSLKLGCAGLVCAAALIAAALPASAPAIAQVTETAAKHHMIAAANPHAAEAGR